ncbi:MAG: hypothetical protein MJ000_08130 [Bacteroidales bacterium]|nr:hypothetical protein [Bacteroidales bacterium]
MKEENKKEEIQSRREFFKEAAKGALPILAFTMLGSTFLTSCKKDDDGHGSGCGSKCTGSCESSCSGDCDGGCSNNCDSFCGGDCWAYCESQYKS